MKITVTKKDIASGKRYDPLHCPVAKAIKRKQHKKVLVNPDLAGAIIIVRNNIIYRHNITPAVVTKIKEFDFTGKMTPFSFETSRG